MALKNSPIKYRLGAMIGRGGMAEVLCGELLGEDGFSKLVAIKRLHPHLSDDPSVVRYFKREAALWARLEHPNIVLVTDFVRNQDGRLFLVMERVDGIELRQLMDAGQMPWELAQHVFRRILDALEYAHEREVIHCDVTPRNILITRRGQVKLSDFGLARAMKASESGNEAIRGTLGYVSPEILQGQPVDQRADLYSAGAVMYELVTGRTAYDQASLADWQDFLTDKQPLVPVRVYCPDIPEELDAVITRLLARNPADRFASAGAALAALPSARYLSRELAVFANIAPPEGSRDEYYSFRRALSRQAAHILEQAQRDKGGTQPAARGAEFGPAYAETESVHERDALALPFAQNDANLIDNQQAGSLSGGTRRKRSLPLALGYDAVCTVIALGMSAALALAPSSQTHRLSPREQREAVSVTPAPHSLPLVNIAGQMPEQAPYQPPRRDRPALDHTMPMLPIVQGMSRKPEGAVSGERRAGQPKRDLRQKQEQDQALVAQTSQAQEYQELDSRKSMMPTKMGNDVASTSKTSATE